METSDKMMVHNAVERVCQLLGNVSSAEIMSKKREFRIATARQLVMWYLYEVCGMSYPDIGRAMGKTHATILYGVRQANVMINSGRKYDRKFREAAEKLRVA